MEENQNTIIEKKDNSKIWIILTITFGIIIIGLIGYISHNKSCLKKENMKETPPEMEQNNANQKAEDKEQTETNDTEEELALGELQIAYKLFNIFHIGDRCFMTPTSSEIPLNTSNKVKLRIAYESISPKYLKITSCSSEEEIIGGSICGGDTKTKEPGLNEAYEQNDTSKIKEIIRKYRYTETIDSKIIKEKTEELYGSDYTYQPEDFGLGILADETCYFMHYSTKSNLYAVYSGQCGGICVPYTEQFSKAYKIDGRLYLETNLENKKAVYEFKKDTKNDNYVFVQVTIK